MKCDTLKGMPCLMLRYWGVIEGDLGDKKEGLFSRTCVVLETLSSFVCLLLLASMHGCIKLLQR